MIEKVGFRSEVLRFFAPDFSLSAGQDVEAEKNLNTSDRADRNFESRV